VRRESGATRCQSAAREASRTSRGRDRPEASIREQRGLLRQSCGRDLIPLPPGPRRRRAPQPPGPLPTSSPRGGLCRAGCSVGRHDQPADDVEENPNASCKGQEDETDPDKDRVNVEVVAKTGSHSAEHRRASIPCQPNHVYPVSASVARPERLSLSITRTEPGKLRGFRSRRSQHAGGAQGTAI